MCPVLLAFLILSSNGEYRFTQEMFSTSYNSYSPTGAVDFDKCVLHGEDIRGEISHMLRDHTSIKECVKSPVYGTTSAEWHHFKLLLKCVFLRINAVMIHTS